MSSGLNDETTSEIELWLAILHEANALNGQLPGSVRAEIEAADSPRELTRMTVHLAALSTTTRRRIEAVLLDVLGVESISPLAEHDETPLHLVAQGHG